MGTVEAEAAVHIGAQVAGVIVALIISHSNFAEFAISLLASGQWHLAAWGHQETHGESVAIDSR